MGHRSSASSIIHFHGWIVYSIYIYMHVHWNRILGISFMPFLKEQHKCINKPLALTTTPKLNLYPFVLGCSNWHLKEIRCGLEHNCQPTKLQIQKVTLEATVLPRLSQLANKKSSILDLINMIPFSLFQSGMDGKRTVWWAETPNSGKISIFFGTARPGPTGERELRVNPVGNM